MASAEDSSAEILETRLRAWGFAPRRARDGQEALALLTEGDAPGNGMWIAILDAALPQMSGIELAAELRSLESRRPVWTILLGNDADARDAGIDDLLRKPVDVVELRLRLSVAERVQMLTNQLRAQTEAAHFHERHDKLTGLWNRDTVLRMLFAETDRAQRLKSPLALVLIDLDHFARVNSEYGHDGGDIILQELARRLRRYLRSYDLLGRSGEDEFLAALPGCDSEQALGLAQRVKRSILSRPFMVGEEMVTVTASVGISHSQGRSPLVVLREAEQALAKAQRAGRNCERVFAVDETQVARAAAGGLRLVSGFAEN